MSVREQILSFLREPRTFASGAHDGAVWLEGLRDFAEPSIAAHGDYPLQDAQIAAWNGLAEARAGLILGPPGTGKTYLLSWLILGYIKARKDAGLPCRVFVSAFTRNAIGNLLDAVTQRCAAHWPGEVQVHYLGSAPNAGLSPMIRHRERLDGRNAEAAIDELMAQDCVVVGGSIWSLYRLLNSAAAPGADGLTAEMFDLVCIDEASQMVLGHGLMALGALRPGGRIVVAGDDRQLPPVRASREVQLGERQLGGSLYTFLKSGEAPEFALDRTFRLNGPLAAFPERKFYEGRYRSAVEARRLTLKPDWEAGLDDWERVALDPQWPICVLLHDGPPAATSNPLEADLAVRLAALLADRLPDARSPEGGYAPDLWIERMAIVSPHRAQNAAIRKTLPEPLRQGAFVETVDRIQGKERDTVLLSYCVADGEFALAEGEFIFSPERLNVAITRARTKLIVLVSRRLLDAVPGDQEVMDKAELLREFIFSCSPAGDIQHRTREGQDVRVQLRVLGFSEDQVIQEIRAKAPDAGQGAALELTPHLENVLAAVHRAALAHPSGEARIGPLRQLLARSDDLLSDLAPLHALGCIALIHRTGQFGPYWSAKPLDPARAVYAPDYAAVKQRLPELISQLRRGGFAPRYEDVRDRFAWVDPQGHDLLRAAIDQLKNEGCLTLGSWRDKLTVDWVEREEKEPLPDGFEAGTEPLTDEDFEILNELETQEAAKINFGVFESWTSVATLAAAAGRRRTVVLASLGKLVAAGWVMSAEEGRYRSRMAELAREIRYVKQRFAREDADRRPFLVRALKVELRDRDKPVRSFPLKETFEALAADVSHRPAHATALRSLADALAKMWGQDASIAGFQARGLQALTKAWLGEGGDSFVIAADTGSGKTEAAGLPLIAAAAADRLEGVRGVRAILAYPRIRLATNQAQRLAGYLAALAREPGLPTVTLGLQVGQVPESFSQLHDRDKAAGWDAAGEGRFAFPFFGCPACGSDLLLEVDGGTEGADALSCTRCSWKYAGWIGSKTKLRASPPNLFLPTTDSLHQWLHDPRYGALFGDEFRFAPPRAILADEIHLYSHVHGAQVGLTLRRLAARAESNEAAHRGLLAIGMSATLGDPAKAWGKLVNRTNVTVIAPSASEKLRNPRGREYFFFVQPEVESRGQDIAGASTTIQTLMCLAHGMRRRTGSEGGFRSLVFLDSIDKVRRLHAAYTDAEEAKRLHRYRTRWYLDPVDGQPRDSCCGEPQGCDNFRTGECWWFAARDTGQVGAKGRRPAGASLRVADQPIFSGATGRVERLIQDSDVVFSTSSLEVGYDDPNITLVYQHYAPQNLASFIQRKGRGGRGADDRPITGVTLSIYSSHDSWWFRKPHEMIEPTGFESPLNPDNHFVRRGQVLAATLDGFAQFERRSGRAVNPRSPSPEAFTVAASLVRQVFGPEPWREFDESPSLEAFWALAVRHAGSGEPRSLPAMRQAIDWIPNVLFETINIPQLLVHTSVGQEPKREDVALALATAAPGNATRRFEQVGVYWRPPTDGPAPWFDPADYQQGFYPKPYGEDAAGLLAQLPEDARPLLDGLSAAVFRPRTLRLARLGQMHGVGWQSDWTVSTGAQPACQLTPNQPQGSKHVQHDSRASLRGFPIIKSYPDRARALTLPGLEPWIARTEWFAGDSLGGRETGLAMARVYWGADAEVRLVGPKEEPAVFTQIFTNVDGRNPLLHGYHVQTEGVRLMLRTERIDAFIDAEAERLDDDEPTRRWHAGQMLRYAVESGAQAIGVNSYEARRGAELLLSAAGHPDLRPRLSRLLRFWSGEDLAVLLEETRAALLSQHPLLSPGRVARVAQTLSTAPFQKVFAEAITAVSDAGRFKRYLKSSLIHSLATRLKQSFLRIGHGDERQVLMHVRLPIQFAGETEAIITLCETGAFGDGTTRGFAERADEMVAHWRNGFISGCPNAEEDAAVNRLFALEHEHPAWRALDPNQPEALRQIQAALSLDASMPIPSAVLRILFGRESFGAEQFALYDLATSIRRIDLDLASRLKRAPTAWELTSTAVADAAARPETTPGRLLSAYRSLDEAEQEDSLSPESRLADQVFRLHARLCVDGCQACVHQGSDMMSDTLVEASTSRRLLQRFVEG